MTAIVLLFALDRRDVSDRGDEATVIEPIDPVERGQLNRVDAARTRFLRTGVGGSTRTTLPKEWSLQETRYGSERSVGDPWVSLRALLVLILEVRRVDHLEPLCQQHFGWI